MDRERERAHSPLASERIGRDERLRFARCSAASSIVDFRLECHAASTLSGRVLYPATPELCSFPSPVGLELRFDPDDKGSISGVAPDGRSRTLLERLGHQAIGVRVAIRAV